MQPLAPSSNLYTDLGSFEVVVKILWRASQSISYNLSTVINKVKTLKKWVEIRDKFLMGFNQGCCQFPGFFESAKFSKCEFVVLIKNLKFNHFYSVKY